VIEDIQDIDKSRPQLEKLYPGIEIVDNRSVNNRYDDVLVVLRKPLIDKSWSPSGNDNSFRGNNTEEHWVDKHKQQYEVNKDFDFTGMTDLSYIKVAGDLIIGNQDKFNRKSILDVGCAVGKAVKYFKDKLPSFECTGWDFSESGIVAAREKIPNCTFEQRDIILNPIDTEYGCITMMETIEHLQEGTNYKVLDNILDHCEYAIVSTVDTEDNCFGEHISHYKIDTFDKKGYDVVWKSPLDVINMPEGLFHYVIFLIKGKL
jgi:2-polyprenyl-3-methyl-5-hydroxy-6-metoxy-1,4-benzoquinol methylase